jgi:hypothetical protein
MANDLTTSNTPLNATLVKGGIIGFQTFGFGFIAGVSIVALIFIVLFILIICRYRYQQDEGSYTIDETKNYGPFAELDTPLTSGANSKKNKNKKNRRNQPNTANKEWFV